MSGKVRSTLKSKSSCLGHAGEKRFPVSFRELLGDLIILKKWSFVNEAGTVVINRPAKKDY